jgi:chemotaxis protein histidine kinase CheA
MCKQTAPKKRNSGSRMAQENPNASHDWRQRWETVGKSADSPAVFKSFNKRQNKTPTKEGKAPNTRKYKKSVRRPLRLSPSTSHDSLVSATCRFAKGPSSPDAKGFIQPRIKSPAPEVELAPVSPVLIPAPDTIQIIPNIDTVAETALQQAAEREAEAFAAAALAEEARLKLEAEALAAAAIAAEEAEKTRLKLEKEEMDRLKLEMVAKEAKKDKNKRKNKRRKNKKASAARACVAASTTEAQPAPVEQQTQPLVTAAPSSVDTNATDTNKDVHTLTLNVWCPSKVLGLKSSDYSLLLTSLLLLACALSFRPSLATPHALVGGPLRSAICVFFSILTTLTLCVWGSLHLAPETLTDTTTKLALSPRTTAAVAAAHTLCVETSEEVGLFAWRFFRSGAHAWALVCRVVM